MYYLLTTDSNLRKFRAMHITVSGATDLQMTDSQDALRTPLLADFQFPTAEGPERQIFGHLGTLEAG